MDRLNKIRLKLTLVNTLVLISLSLFVGIVIYLFLNYNVESGLASNLKIYSSQLATNIEYIEAKESAKPVEGEKLAAYEELLSGLYEERVGYMIWNEDFDILQQADMDPFTEEEMLRHILNYFTETRDTGNPYVLQDLELNGRQYKLCTYPIVNHAGELKVVQTVKNISPETSLINNFIKTMALALVMGAALSVVMGYILSGRSLIPIRESMAQQEAFLADASHELRTPISVIQTNLEVVRTSPEESVAEQLSWLDNAYKETVRMNSIVSDLLFLALADAGRVELKKEAIDIGFLAMEVTERMLPLGAKKRVNLLADIPAEPLMIYGDKNQITQVLVILIDNAIKYSKENDIVTITGREAYYDVQITISDNGIGLSSEDIDNIFRRFYRVDKTRSRSEGGTGLGLSIADWIVKQNKGSIKVKSQPGHGTEMIVIFLKYSENERNENVNR
ncbi:MAG: HAMP domain-containing histidine kinase [Eubacteriaceae bacterium]|nr:HAMP domain-containing histidine kinase [Eubacteriaceae bacterium]